MVIFWTCALSPCLHSSWACTNSCALSLSPFVVSVSPPGPVIQDLKPYFSPRWRSLLGVNSGAWLRPGGWGQHAWKGYLGTRSQPQDRESCVRYFAQLHLHYTDEQTEGQRHGGPCPKSPRALGPSWDSLAPCQALLSTLSCPFCHVCTHKSRLCECVPPPPTWLLSSLCLCTGPASLWAVCHWVSLCLGPHVWVWCAHSGGMDMTMYSAHMCRTYVCVSVWGRVWNLPGCIPVCVQTTAKGLLVSTWARVRWVFGSDFPECQSRPFSPSHPPTSHASPLQTWVPGTVPLLQTQGSFPASLSQLSWALLQRLRSAFMHTSRPPVPDGAGE